MGAKFVTLCLITLIITGILCRPGKRFLELDCDKQHNCTEQGKPICCTDGKTYPSQCHLNRMNQIKVCSLGDFNPIETVHEGPCHKD